MQWVEFTDAFHNQACKTAGIPYPGENQATGELEFDAQWTTAYASPVDDGGIRKVLVSDADAKSYGLVATKAPTFPNPYLGETGTKPVPVKVEKPVPTDKLDIAVILVDRAIRTKEETVALLKVDPVALDTALAEVDVIAEPVEPVIKKR